MKYWIYKNGYSKKCLAIERIEILAGDIWCNNNLVFTHPDAKFIEYLFETLLKYMKSNKAFIDFNEVLNVATNSYNKEDDEDE